MARALSGVRCAVIPIILGAALRLREKSLTGKSSYVLAAIALFVCTFTKVNQNSRGAWAGRYSDF